MNTYTLIAMALALAAAISVNIQQQIQSGRLPVVPISSESLCTGIDLNVGCVPIDLTPAARAP
ncbi:MAG TPA: hypothetical protein VMI56_07030 [Reyranella sp.]|nr:hypothetical protein [Reyranella sp.]